MEKFESHTRVFSLLTMVSRVTGLARDAAFSRVFGAGALMDAFFFAFILPNLFRRLFGEGAASAAFLRVYARLDDRDPDTARRLATLMLGVMFVGLGGIAIAGELVLVLVAGRGGLAVRLMMIMLPYMPLVCLVALTGAMLQVRGRFGPSAAVPVVLNLCLLATTVGLAPVFESRATHVAVVAASVVVAGVLQTAWMVLVLGGGAFALRGLAAARPALREVLAQAGPMVLGLGIFQLNAFLDGLIASYPTTVGPTFLGRDYPLSSGAMAAVSFAQRLYQFPLGVFGIAVATAIYPALARQAYAREHFADILRRGLRLVLFIGLPASAGLMLVGPLAAAVIYQGGSFGAADARRVAFVLTGYAAAVWAYSGVHVLTRACYAQGDARTPVRIALLMVCLNLLLNVTLIWTPLREAGLAWSTAACATLQVGLLLRVACRRSPGLLDADVRRCALQSAGLTAVMAATVAGLLALLPAAGDWRTALPGLVAALAAGVLVVVGGSALLRMPEPGWLLRR